jgi:hypothetical protein
MRLTTRNRRNDQSGNMSDLRSRLLVRKGCEIDHFDVHDEDKIFNGIPTLNQESIGEKR